MKKYFKKDSGISLIVLVVTIIVIIILAGAVILSLTQNNPIEEANQASFMSNADTYMSEYNLYISSEYIKAGGSFLTTSINKTAWNGNDSMITGSVKEVIKTMTAKDGPKFKIENGEFGYIGTDLNEKKWAGEMNLKVF